ncbi:MAG: hypothetical protein JW762_11085 [Dehalococcoidales bacterium]|nr:hypothetical protein [Dehalococcoidales bacterium]
MGLGKIKHYVPIILLVSLSAVLCAAVTGCNTTVQPVDTLEELIDRLEKSGLEIEITDRSVRNIHLSVEGFVFIIEGENTQLFEYADVDTANIQFQALTGPGPGLVFFEENEPPLVETGSSDLEVYHSGRFTLLYSGDNEEVRKALKDVLGQPMSPR